MIASNQVTPTNIVDLIKSVSIQIGTSGKHARFKRLYAHDRVAFVHDILPSFAKSMAPYQEEIFGYFDEGFSRVSVRGPHGLGKTAMASILVNHSVLTAETDCKVPTTASAWRQLEKYLWPEIKKSARFLDWIEIGREKYTKDELLQISIKLNGGIVEAFAVASDDFNTIEGAHATRIVYVFDEAKTIPRPTWNAAEGAFSTEGLSVTDYEKGSIPVGKTNSNNDSPIEESSIGAIEKSPNVLRVSVSESNGSSSSIGEGSGSNSNAGNSNTKISHTSAPPSALLATRDRSAATSTGVEDHRQQSTQSTSVSIYEALAFAISTPGDPSGQFYDIHMKKPGYTDWKTRHVTVDEAIAAGRISHKWVEQRKQQWGEDSSVFMNRVLGEFADSTEEGVIPLSWIRAAVQRWYEWERTGFAAIGEEILGVDVARSGEDKTVIAHRYGLGVQKLHIYSKLSAVSNAGHVKALCAGKKVHIEMDGGLGASVYDILREQGVRNLVPITVGAKTNWKDRSGELSFINVRAAMWWNMREILDPTYNSVVKLPPVEELILDLSTPRWEMTSNATVKIESKANIALRIGRSTDYGDSVCLSFWNASRGGGIVF